MSQPLPLTPPIPLLDGRLSVPRDRPADIAQRHAFHRLLDRFTQNDSDQDPAKDTVSATRDQRPRERSCSTDDSTRPSDDASAADKASDPTDAPAAPAQAAASHTDSTPPRAPDAAPAANPPAPGPAAVPVAAIVPAVTVAAVPVPTTTDGVAPAATTAPIVAALSAAPAAVEATAAGNRPAPTTELAAAADAAKAAAPSSEPTADAAVPMTAADLLNLAQAARPTPRTKPAIASDSGPRTAPKATNATADKPSADAAVPQPSRFLAARLTGEAQVAGNANSNTDGAQGLSQIRAVRAEASAAATDAALSGLRDDRSASNGSDQAIATLTSIDSPSRSAALYHKVADAAKPGADAPTPADQISIRLVHAVAEGKRAIQMHLHPAELGSIDVKLQWQGDKLTAQFTVDRPETLQLLQREVPALERSLGQAGVNVDSGSLSFSLRQQQGNGKGNGEGFDQAAANAGLGDGGESGAGDAPLGQVIRDGILSIRV